MKRRFLHRTGGTQKWPSDGRLTAHESQSDVIYSDFNARQPRRHWWVAHLRDRGCGRMAPIAVHI